MGNKGVISEEEQRVLQEFWVYCQPVDLYACLSGRLRRNPVFLGRTLCYHREAALTPGSVRGHAGSLQLELRGLGTAPLSVVAALCHRTEAGGFVPASSTLLHLPANHMGASVDGAAAAAASLALPHAAAAVNGDARELVVLVLAMEAHQDLRHLKPQQGARMTSSLRRHLAFGLIPVESLVLWGYSPISSQNLASQQFVSLAKVTLQPGTLHIQQSSGGIQRNGHAAAPPACLSFRDAASGQHHQGQCQLWLQVRREGVLPQLPGRSDSKVRVFYQYFYHNDERHVVEKMVGYKCAFCRMACRSLTGLQQHLEASHDLFVYGFSRDHPDVVPTVNVHIAPDIYNSKGEFVQLDIDAYHMPANKEFVFCCSRLQRSVRVQQYQLQPKAGELVERPQAPPQGSKLPPFRTLLREPLNRMSSIDDSTASDQQAADGVPVARRKASRMLPLPLRVKQPGVRYFHSRSCIPMTREEAQASMDSDDEPDTEAWQRRAREQLRDMQDLHDCEKEFVLNWNSSTERKPIYGDLFLPARVHEFAQEHAKVLAGHAQLRECFVNFLIILWDYCLLSSEQVDACVELMAV